MDNLLTSLEQTAQVRITHRRSQGITYLYVLMYATHSQYLEVYWIQRGVH